jgi:hypothetical protein
MGDTPQHQLEVTIHAHAQTAHSRDPHRSTCHRRCRRRDRRRFGGLDELHDHHAGRGDHHACGGEHHAGRRAGWLIDYAGSEWLQQAAVSQHGLEDGWRLLVGLWIELRLRMIEETID